jgi:hypothetical protein
VPFIEPAGSQVVLETPKLESLRSRLLGGLHQQTSGTATDSVGMGVEHADLLLAAGQERDDAGAILGDRDVTLLENYVANEASILLCGVQHRQEGEQPEGSCEHVGNRIAIPSRRLPSCENSHDGILKPA